MEMNDILNGLNSCGDPGTESNTSNDLNNAGMFPPSMCGGGCGFNAWIWILLILFYCTSGSGMLGGNNGVCCCKKDECCCCSGNNSGTLGSGLLNSCSSYLFLLVILFLCNRCNGYGPCASLANTANMAY